MVGIGDPLALAYRLDRAVAQSALRDSAGEPASVHVRPSQRQVRVQRPVPELIARVVEVLNRLKGARRNVNVRRRQKWAVLTPL